MIGKDRSVPPEFVPSTCRFGYRNAGAISLIGIRAISPPYTKWPDSNKGKVWSIDVFYENSDKITIEDIKTLDDAIISANTIFRCWMDYLEYLAEWDTYRVFLEHEAILSRGII